MAKKAKELTPEQLIRQQARSMYKVAESMKMMRHAQEGTLGQYIISREVRKVQAKANRQLRKMMGLK